MKSYFLILLLIGVSIQQQTGKRPEPVDRKFTSSSVDQMIEEVQKDITNPILSQLFENTLPNTLDTTVGKFEVGKDGQSDSFIITGDINAMWLRDSSNQILTYKQFYVRDEHLQSLVKGVIRRQIRYVLLDPFANAFNYGTTGSDWASDQTFRNFFGVQAPAMISQLHERKFEIDSLTSVLHLQNVYFQETGDHSIFDYNYFKCLKKIITVFQNMQKDHSQEGDFIQYSFQRDTSEPTDTTSHGRGFPSKHTGLIRSFFRPSDDSTVYQFNIPCNAYASSMLQQTATILNSLIENSKVSYLQSLLSAKFKKISNDLGKQVRKAIFKHGLSANGEYLVYEVDGYGNKYFMDDANQPSLLGLPLYGFLKEDDPLYIRTRKNVLSERNPYYFVGKQGKGIGGPHVGLNYIWPMSIIVQAMTTNDKTEIKVCLQTLLTTHADTFFMHESFHKDDQYKFTRSWFAWVNGLFGELVLRIHNEMPELLY